MSGSAKIFSSSGSIASSGQQSGSPAPIGSSASSSSSSSSGECPTFEWTESYTGTGNTWTFISDKHLTFNVEPTTSCGGSNDGAQYAHAVASVTVPAGKKMTLEWEMTVVAETANIGFDEGAFMIDGVDESRLSSTTEDTRCTDDDPPPSTCCDTKAEYDTGTKVLTAGTYDIAVEFDTIDGNWHQTTVGIDFHILSCSIEDV